MQMLIYHSFSCVYLLHTIFDINSRMIIYLYQHALRKKQEIETILCVL